MVHKIKEIASRLFQEGKIDLFMAWEKGDFDYQTRPLVINNAEDVSRIAFDQYSIHNLANMLLRYRDGDERIGIVVKGCDSRGIVRLLQDYQFQRERLYIVGVCCPGMKDPLMAMKAHSGLGVNAEVTELAAKCRDCIQPNPVIYDELLGEKQPVPMQGERFARVKALEELSYDERYSFFEKAFSTCIRCYACRQACIACNCRVCIFDEMKPQWVGRSTSVSDNMMYHLVRSFHMVGRCIECGECERVCPVNIPLMAVNQKLIKDVSEFFGPYEAGVEYIEGARPPLSAFKENDPDDFL